MYNGNNDFPAGTSQSTFKADNETKKTVSFYFLRKMDVAEAHDQNHLHQKVVRIYKTSALKQILFLWY